MIYLKNCQLWQRQAFHQYDSLFMPPGTSFLSIFFSVLLKLSREHYFGCQHDALFLERKTSRPPPAHFLNAHTMPSLASQRLHLCMVLQFLKSHVTASIATHDITIAAHGRLSLSSTPLIIQHTSATSTLRTWSYQLGEILR